MLASSGASRPGTVAFCSEVRFAGGQRSRQWTEGEFCTAVEKSSTQGVLLHITHNVASTAVCAPPLMLQVLPTILLAMWPAYFLALPGTVRREHTSHNFAAP